MELKQILKIGFVYSLIFSLLLSLLSVLPGNLGFPVNTFFLILIIIFAHKKYSERKKNTFTGILILSFIFIFFSYFFEYLLGTVFYYFSKSESISTQESNGLLGLSKMFENDKPIFSPFFHLIEAPLYELKFYLINLDFLNFNLTLLYSKFFVISVVIYFESLFYLFVKFGKKPWQAIIPVQNNLILLSIAQKPKWWIILLYIPVLKRVFLYFMNNSIAKKFEKNSLFALGMTFLPPFFYGAISLDNRKERKLNS